MYIYQKYITKRIVLFFSAMLFILCSIGILLQFSKLSHLLNSSISITYFLQIGCEYFLIRLFGALPIIQWISVCYVYQNFKNTFELDAFLIGGISYKNLTLTISYFLISIIILHYTFNFFLENKLMNSVKNKITEIKNHNMISHHISNNLLQINKQTYFSADSLDNKGLSNIIIFEFKPLNNSRITYGEKGLINKNGISIYKGKSLEHNNKSINYYNFNNLDITLEQNSDATISKKTYEDNITRNNFFEFLLQKSFQIFWPLYTLILSFISVKFIISSKNGIYYSALSTILICGIHFGLYDTKKNDITYVIFNILLIIITLIISLYKPRKCIK